MAKPKNKKKKEFLRWVVSRKGVPLRLTTAVSEARARDNGWFVKIRKNARREDMPEVKRIYHEEITARPVFTQPHRRIKLRKAKARPGQGSMFTIVAHTIEVTKDQSNSKRSKGKKKRSLPGQGKLFRL